MPLRSSLTRTILGFFLSLFVFVNVVAIGVLGRPQVAHAIPVVDVVQAPLQTGVVIKTSIFEAIWDVLVGAVTAGVIFIAQRVAYDAALALADAGAGKTPVFQFKNFDEYLKDTAEDAMAQALDVLATDWVGLDICKPLDIRARLSINLGLRQLTKPQARCTWEQIGAAWDEQWETLKKQYGGCSPSGRTADGSKYNLKGSNSTEDCMLALARDVFKPSNTELGSSVEASIAVQNFVRKKELASTKDREEGQGFTPVKDLVSQHIETPAKAVAKEAEGISGPNVQMQGFQAFSGVLGSGAKGALGGILGIFANTFLSRMGSNVMDGLFKAGPSKDGGGVSTSLSDPGAGSTIGVSPQVAALLTKTVSVRDAGLYDILSQFVSCSSESGDINRRPDECVIDTDFEAAVRSAESGDPLTIKQAMKKGLLKANWRLVSPSDAGLNTDVDCRNQAYCHSNMAKLRQARIVPLGFEIAAALSPVDNPWTLGKAVAGFNDCNNDGGRDANKPFCHLIDPNWLLKAPLTRCKAEVPGPMLAMQDSNLRHSICVDKPTCLQDDGKGGCESTWGYCVREKNIWRLNGDSCPGQFSTCATYTGVSPGAQKNVSYLSRTVDFATCTEQDVGCREYRTQQKRIPNAEGNYEWKEGARYFNGKATTCTQPGCTQFIRQDGASAYLKKAPLYLQCYDADPSADSSLTIDWPEKLANLAKLEPRTECKDYAPVCAKDEVGCTRYTPDNDDPAIPAIAGAGDVCAQECVGYSTYKQMPVTFERAKFPLYFIPDTANQCSGAELGCDQFVNVEAGEKLEYYSFVRQCEKPAPNNTNSVVFYAWEGSDAQGYQLRSYVLKKSAGRVYPDDPTDVTPAYAAAYDAARMSSYREICNKDLYTQRLADPDCRELFDRQGNAYYRLLSKTITVSDQCAVVRKTDPDIYYASRDMIANQAACADAKGAWNPNDGCQICEGGGALQNGVCLYAMMKSEATSCRAEASGCRAYTGNAGNNVRVRYQAKFDDLDTTGWSRGTLSAESVVVGGKSLRVENRNVSLSINSTPAAGSSYLMNFWAKGQGALTVTFDRTEAEPSNTNTFRLTGDWRQFSLGPVYVKSVQDGAAIAFSVDSDIPLFLDNLVIRETIDTVNVVKNSWNTPASCDANLKDNIPGEALGCQLYRDHNDTPTSLKSFTRICRDAAVGCEKLTDTYNTPELEGRTYQVKCGVVNTKDVIGNRFTIRDVIDEASRACTPDWDTDGDGQKENTPVCTIPIGKDYCTFTVNRMVTDDEQLAHGGVRTPADSIAYLVNRQEYRCDVKEKGCSVLGEVTDSVGVQFGRVPKVTSVNKLVDAEKYEQLLCTADVEGCEAYSSNVGGAARTSYFKDPSVTGRPLCEFRENVGGNSGWFMQGTSNPCYAGYRVTGNLYGVKSQGDPGYTGRVGVCPEQNNACKEFRDPADTSQLHPEGQPYYALDNAKIDKSSCNGQGSLEEGCVLFDDVSVPAKLWNAAATYQESASKNGALVAPVKNENVNCIAPECHFIIEEDGEQCPVGLVVDLRNIDTTSVDRCIPQQRVNNANTILKVTRDRACGEWLACLSSMVITDPTTNQLKSLCNNVALCNAYSEANEKFEQCTNWVTAPEFDNRILDVETYGRRSIKWNAMDYSGYALYDKYQIPDYRFVQSAGEPQLVAIPFRYADAKQACRGRPDNDPCVAPLDGAGQCFGGLCTRALGNSTPRQNEQCRGYATTEAPFTFSDEQVEWEAVESDADWGQSTALLKEFNGVNGFDRASVCQQGHTCACSYQTADYGRGEFTRYYDERSDLPLGLCRGGYYENNKDKTGRSCDSNVVCRDERTEVNNVPITDRDRRDGECVFLSKVSNAKGWSGYCLESDMSIRTPGSGVNGHPCLTWMPLDVVPGASSIYNQVQEAGYKLDAFAQGGQHYCAESAGVAKKYSGEQNEANCRKYKSRRVLGHLIRDDPRICEEYYAADKVSYEAHVGGVGQELGGCDKCSESAEFDSSLAKTDDGLKRFSLAMIDYIEVEFNEVHSSEAPSPGIIHIVNNPDRPHIYAKNQETCDDIIKRIVAWQSNEQIQPQCITNGVAHGSSAGLSMVYTQGNTTKLGWMWADGDEDSYDRTFGHVSDGSVFGNNYGAGDGKNTSDGHILWFVFDGDSMTDEVRLNVYNTNESDDPTVVDLTYRVVLREACWSVASVTDGEENVAQTNRVWDVGNTQKSLDNGVAVILSKRVVEFNEKEKPYGSARIPTSDRLLYQRASYETAASSEGGALYYCPDGRCGENVSQNKLWQSDSSSKGEGVLAKLFGRAYRFVKGNNNNLRTLATGYRVNQSTQCQPVAPGAAAGQALGGDNACWDVRALPDFARPPGVASIDTNNCTVGAGDESICRLGTVGRFTINGQDDGVVFGSGDVAVSTRFFSWADTNRGPIRDIRVEWDVPGVIAASSGKGKYKNRKPYCQSSDTTPVATCESDENVTCSTNEECRRSNLGECRKEEWVSFGNAASRGCRAGYYEFIGAYTFDKSDGDKCGYAINGQSPRGMDAAQLRELTQEHGLTAGHRYCAYKPKVIVIDNWGWCNGTCRDGGGCWNGDDVEVNVCTNSGLAAYRNAGTPFAGWVIVAEQK